MERLEPDLEARVAAREQLTKLEASSPDASPYEEGMLFRDRYATHLFLSKGTYGRVFLALDTKDDSDNPRPYAMKVIRDENAWVLDNKDCEEAVLLKKAQEDGSCENIVQCFHSSYDPSTCYCVILMEFCACGDLHNKIKEDVGIGSDEKAKALFKQLLRAVEHLHTRSIAHLDIKLENCFLTAEGTLKLGDFGMAHEFRDEDGVEHRLHKSCGSRLFQSPQVIEGYYRAEPADIWACGVVLVAMLTGAYPWRKAYRDNAKYVAWATKTVSVSTEAPWKRLDARALCLVEGILKHSEKKRLRMDGILEHPWMIEELVAEQ